jgi:type IX secretion system PorP/SprF family membrane protein
MKKINLFAKHICIIFLVMFVRYTNAQDLHFSQFMNAPLTINPANTGFIPDANYRIGANLRQQWAVVPVPYTTVSAWGDVQLGKREDRNGWFGLGAFFINDRAGDGNLRSVKANLNIAYHQELGYDALLSGGFSVGYVNKRVDIANLKFVSQWTGRFIDNQLPSGEVNITTPSINYFDLAAGINYAYYPDDNTYVNGGISLQHANRPDESFFGNASTIDNQLAHRWNFFLNGSFKYNDNLIFNPSAYFSTMASTYELVFGGNVEYNLSGDGETTLLGGMYYRWDDALVPMLGFSWKDLYINFTYDATVSSISNFVGIRGGPEISIIQRGVFSGGGDRQSKCPSFKH